MQEFTQRHIQSIFVSANILFDARFTPLCASYTRVLHFPSSVCLTLCASFQCYFSYAWWKCVHETKKTSYLIKWHAYRDCITMCVSDGYTGPLRPAMLGARLEVRCNIHHRCWRSKRICMQKTSSKPTMYVQVASVHLCNDKEDIAWDCWYWQQNLLCRPCRWFQFFGWSLASRRDEEPFIDLFVCKLQKEEVLMLERREILWRRVRDVLRNGGDTGGGFFMGAVCWKEGHRNGDWTGSLFGWCDSPGGLHHSEVLFVLRQFRLHTFDFLHKESGFAREDFKRHVDQLHFKLTFSLS